MRTICGQSLRWEQGIQVGLKAPASPQCLYEHLKAKMGAPRSALGLGKSSNRDQSGQGEEEEGHTAYVLCLQQGRFTKKSRSCHRPKECERAPRATAREGRGEKSSCQLLCLTVGSGLRAEVRTLQIPTAVVCLQDLRNQTRQLKRNPVV